MQQDNYFHVQKSYFPWACQHGACLLCPIIDSTGTVWLDILVTVNCKPVPVWRYFYFPMAGAGCGLVHGDQTWPQQADDIPHSANHRRFYTLDPVSHTCRCILTISSITRPLSNVWRTVGAWLWTLVAKCFDKNLYFLNKRAVAHGARLLDANVFVLFPAFPLFLPSFIWRMQ